MHRMFDLTAVCVILAVAFSAYAQQCTCGTAKVQDGWCADCKVGYVDAVKIKSRALFDALPGAEVKAEEIKCASCKKAHASDGYCPDCRVGFVGKKKYGSHVAYVLAKGEHKDPAKIQCDGCKKKVHLQIPGAESGGSSAESICGNLSSRPRFGAAHWSQNRRMRCFRRCHGGVRTRSGRISNT